MPAHPSYADDDLAVLAASPLCQVSACPGCGVVHLNLPSMTLRFEPAAFHEVARLMMQASRALEGHRDDADAQVLAEAAEPTSAATTATPPAAPPRRRWH